MRIISGIHRGRKFTPPNNIPTRPTTDIAKEGLFNILNNNIDYSQVSFLDLFAGTGNISYEMASRGCTDITSIDRFPTCIKFIERMIEKLNIEGMRVVQADVFEFLKNNKNKYNLIFAGPPYGMDNLDDLPDIIFDTDTLAEDGIFVLEHNPNHNFEADKRMRHMRNYGQTIFSFFLKSAE